MGGSTLTVHNCIRTYVHGTGVGTLRAGRDVEVEATRRGREGRGPLRAAPCRTARQPRRRCQHARPRPLKLQLLRPLGWGRPAGRVVVLAVASPVAGISAPRVHSPWAPRNSAGVPSLGSLSCGRLSFATEFLGLLPRAVDMGMGMHMEMVRRTAAQLGLRAACVGF